MQTFALTAFKYFLAAVAGALVCYFTLPFVAPMPATAVIANATPTPEPSIETEKMGESERDVACVRKYQKLVDAKFVEYALSLQNMGLPPFSSFYPIENLGKPEAEGFISMQSCKSVGAANIQDGGSHCGFQCAMWGESESFSMELWVPDTKDSEDKEVEVLEMTFNHGA